MPAATIPYCEITMERPWVRSCAIAAGAAAASHAAASANRHAFMNVSSECGTPFPDFAALHPGLHYSIQATLLDSGFVRTGPESRLRCERRGRLDSGFDASHRPGMTA
jgi:hypothetical protein